MNVTAAANGAISLAIILAYPGSGVFAIWSMTPRWMRESDPIGFGLMHIMAIIAGPFLLLGLLFRSEAMRDRDRRDNAWWDERNRNPK